MSDIQGMTMEEFINLYSVGQLKPTLEDAVDLIRYIGEEDIRETASDRVVELEQEVRELESEISEFKSDDKLEELKRELEGSRLKMQT